MKKPSPLQFGDKVIIVASAGIVPQDKINAAVEILKSWGLIPSIGEHCFAEDRYFAGSDAQRLADFQEALDNPEYKAIFCARGGYGTTRIIDHLNFDRFLEDPKWICGFSDLTSLISHVNQLGVEATHSVMPVVFDQHLESTESLRRLLFNQTYDIESKPHSSNKLGSTYAPLVGGNLSILSHILGTKSDTSWEGKIILIEDLNEQKYHIDRMFTQLRRCGKIQKIKGLLVGHMSNLQESSREFGKSMEEIVLENFSHLDIPIAFNIPVGHEEENYALPMGRKVKLVVSEEKTTICIN